MERAAWIVFVLVAAAAAVWLRAHQLDEQVIIDDEWHAIHRLLSANLAAIATHLGFADYSVPLTLLFRLAYEHRALSERMMHVPSLIAGLALLPVCFVLARPWFAWRTRVVWMGFLAISPLLVYHSRVARPYPFTAVLVPVAILLFHRWWIQGRRADAAGYVLAAVVSGYLHPVVLPFVLMPLAYHGVAALYAAAFAREANRLGPLLRGVAIGGLVAVLLALTLGPPLVTDWKLFTAKAGRDAVTLESVYRSALMLAGSQYAWTALVVFGLAAVGTWHAFVRQAGVVTYLLVVLGVASVTIASAGIAYIYHPLVYARYLLPALVFVLLFAAEGVTSLLRRVPAGVVAPVGAGALCASLYLAGPLPAIDYVPNQFTGHLRFQYDYDPAHNPYVTQVPREPVPAFYRMLAEKPAGSLTLIEMPWRLESNFNPHPWYQEVHRQNVLIGFVTPVCGVREFGEYPEDEGMRMRRFIHLSALLRGETRGAQYLVVHLNPWKTPPDADVEWPDMQACLPTIEAALGKPMLSSDGLVVFALRADGR
jgi:hypothetical protein